MVSTADDEPAGAAAAGAGDATSDGEPADAGKPGGRTPADDEPAGAAGTGTGNATADAAGPGARAAGDTTPATAGEGGDLVRWNLWATVAFAVTSALAAAAPDTFSVVSVPVALALFAVGSVLFAWGFLVGLGRSRYEAVTLGGLFFLAEGAAPAPVRRVLRALLAVQVVVAVVAAAVRPFTELAFGVLVPTLGLGAITLWAARYATFPPRPPERGR
jgi:hypothetical protein